MVSLAVDVGSAESPTYSPPTFVYPHSSLFIFYPFTLLDYALSPETIKASILLNKLRLIGIFDLIMELKSFVFDKLPESEGEEEGE